MMNYDHLYIGGHWTTPSGEGVLEVIESATEKVMGSIPEGVPKDVDRAVLAARRAVSDLSTATPAQRAELLDDLAAALRERRREIAELIAREVGTPIGMAVPLQAGLPAQVADSYARLAREYDFEEEVGHSLVVREPIGVVGAITPWNFPLHQIVAKLAPAIAAGCPVVLKPSEVAPLNAFVLAEIVDRIGWPAGVFNLVSGLGPIVGEALALHPEVDMVSFTGSTHAGKRVAELAAGTVKRVSQELGGKSANLILDDADLERAIKTGVNQCFLNSGQACNAWSRMLVPRQRHDEAAELARAAATRLPLGEPLSGRAKLGPLVSHVQRERVRAYIRRGIDEGARLVCGGPETPADLPHGFYVKPTVFAAVKSEMTIAREEIFGPVLAILPYDDEDDAVRIANDTLYGLAGAVWSNDVERARRVARRLRTGQVDVNGGRFNLRAPFGGYRQSGNGRELGRFGLEEYLEIKAIQL